MQYVTSEIEQLIRKEAEIDLKAQTGRDRIKPEQIEKRFRELMIEEYQLAGLSAPQTIQVNRK